MEKAVALDFYGSEALRLAARPGYGTLVLGSEFCERLLPDAREFAAFRDLFPGRLALATPLLTDDGLDRVRELLRLGTAGGRRLEVVANDLGLLEVLRAGFRRGVEVSCGRVLANRVRIMPREYARGFLARYKVARIEADDAGALARLKALGPEISWHHPFRYATLTRFCPWEKRWAFACARSCRGKATPLSSPRVPETLWLRGPAYFVKGQGPRRDAARCVFTPSPKTSAPVRTRR
ncbi:MAG: hypothetical protein WC969_13365 [Elusimicrobiota bacterium]|jgi:hypothetical protein